MWFMRTQLYRLRFSHIQLDMTLVLQWPHKPNGLKTCFLKCQKVSVKVLFKVRGLKI